MTYFVYILFSKIKGNYYIGYTSDEMNEGLRRHNTNHKGFTGGIGDWSIVYTESYESESDARKRELQIKKRKSRVMIERLISKHSSTDSDYDDF